MSTKHVQVRQRDVGTDLRLGVYDGERRLTADELLDLVDATLVLENCRTQAVRRFPMALHEDEIVYAWQEGDLDVAGAFRYEVELTWTNGKVQTAPTGGALRLEVIARLD